MADTITSKDFYAALDDIISTTTILQLRDTDVTARRIMDRAAESGRAIRETTARRIIARGVEEKKLRYLGKRYDPETRRSINAWEIVL